MRNVLPSKHGTYGISPLLLARAHPRCLQSQSVPASDSDIQPRLPLILDTLPEASREEKQSIFNEIHPHHFIPLIQDALGNYNSAIQCILETGRPEDKALIIAQLQGRLLFMARDPTFARKCLPMRTQRPQWALMDEIMESPSTPDASTPIVVMMKDAYGSGYCSTRVVLSLITNPGPSSDSVLQRALGVAEGDQKEALINTVRPQLLNMRRSSTAYSKHVTSIGVPAPVATIQIDLGIDVVLKYNMKWKVETEVKEWCECVEWGDGGEEMVEVRGAQSAPLQECATRFLGLGKDKDKDKDARERERQRIREAERGAPSAAELLALHESSQQPNASPTSHFSPSTPPSSTSGSSNGHGDLTPARTPSRLGAERGARDTYHATIIGSLSQAGSTAAALASSSSRKPDAKPSSFASNTNSKSTSSKADSTKSGGGGSQTSLLDKAVRYLDGNANPDRSSDKIWLMGVRLPGWGVKGEERVALARTPTLIMGTTTGSRSVRNDAVPPSCVPHRIHLPRLRPRTPPTLPETQIGHTMKRTTSPRSMPALARSLPRLRRTGLVHVPRGVRAHLRSAVPLIPPASARVPGPQPSSPSYNSSGTLAESASTVIPTSPKMQHSSWGGRQIRRRGAMRVMRDTGWGCMSRTSQSLLASAFGRVGAGDVGSTLLPRPSAVSHSPSFVSPTSFLSFRPRRLWLCNVATFRLFLDDGQDVGLAASGGKWWTVPIWGVWGMEIFGARGAGETFVLEIERNVALTLRRRSAGDVRVRNCILGRSRLLGRRTSKHSFSKMGKVRVLHAREEQHRTFPHRDPYSPFPGRRPPGHTRPSRTRSLRTPTQSSPRSSCTENGRTNITAQSRAQYLARQHLWCKPYTAPACPRTRVKHSRGWRWSTQVDVAPLEQRRARVG
ncbi:hypothetical protein K438DRAFT_1763983 [Mycena galopus ATCC 62051]|nr:hypothetical protein K438DRAFT_1763983 [Mycena galopus ATCC 62051]